MTNELGAWVSNPVVAYFDGIADVYDEVLPFFADFAEATVEQRDAVDRAETRLTEI